jgi:4a-hydroxytetrahydrobiopterin dehydratase
MSRPTKLPAAEVDAWLAAHAGWERAGEGTIARTFKLPDFAAALSFVVRVGLAAEERDHHPDVELGWGRARFLWTTHDAGGVTSLDLELAAATDASFPFPVVAPA